MISTKTGILSPEKLFARNVVAPLKDEFIHPAQENM
jgi:hypothetical protein